MILNDKWALPCRNSIPFGSGLVSKSISLSDTSSPEEEEEEEEEEEGMR